MWNQWSQYAGAPPLPTTAPPPPPQEPGVGATTTTPTIIGPMLPTATVAVAAPLPATPVPTNFTAPAVPAATPAPVGTNPYSQYTAAQYAAMTPEQQYALQQHWQQWQKYQEEYARWHAQYGEQYKREMELAQKSSVTSTAIQTAGAPAAYASSYYQQPPPSTSSNKISGQPQLYTQPPPPQASVSTSNTSNPISYPPLGAPPPVQTQPPWQTTQQPPSFNQPPPNFNQQSANNMRKDIQQFQQPPWGGVPGVPPPLRQENSDNSVFSNRNDTGNRGTNDSVGTKGWQGPPNNRTGSRGNMTHNVSTDNWSYNQNTSDNSLQNNRNNHKDSVNRNFSVSNRQQGDSNVGANEKKSEAVDNSITIEDDNVTANSDELINNRANDLNRGQNNVNDGPTKRNSGQHIRGQNTWSDGSDTQNNIGPNEWNDNTRGPNNRNFGPNNRGLNNWNQRFSNRGPNSWNEGPNNRGPNNGNDPSNSRGPNSRNEGSNNRDQNSWNEGPHNRGPSNWNEGPNNRNSNNWNNGPYNRGNGPNDWSNNHSSKDRNLGSTNRGFNTWNESNINRGGSGGVPLKDSNTRGPNDRNFGQGCIGNNSLNDNDNSGKEKKGPDSWENNAQNHRARNDTPNQRTGPSSGTTSGSGNRSRITDLDEENFDRQFRQWEQQFEDWKKANANHPDKEMYKRYEQEFEKQRKRIAERREQMRRRKLEQMGVDPNQPPPQPSPSCSRTETVGNENSDNIDPVGKKRNDSIGSQQSSNSKQNQDQNSKQTQEIESTNEQEMKSEITKQSDEEEPDATERTLPDVNKLDEESNEIATNKKESPNKNKNSATPLGKRKSRFGTPVAAIKIKPVESTEIITLDDDDTEIDHVEDNQGNISEIFKKVDGIPGLDLTDDNFSAHTDQKPDKVKFKQETKMEQSKFVQIKTMSSAIPKKIPSLFEIKVDKPDMTDLSDVKEQTATLGSSTTLPDLAKSLNDPDFLKRISEAVAHVSDTLKGQEVDGRKLSFSEWQQRKQGDFPENKTYDGNTDLHNTNSRESFRDKSSNRSEAGEELNSNFNSSGGGNRRCGDLPNNMRANNFVPNNNFGSSGPDIWCSNNSNNRGPNGPSIWSSNGPMNPDPNGSNNWGPNGPNGPNIWGPNGPNNWGPNNSFGPNNQNNWCPNGPNNWGPNGPNNWSRNGPNNWGPNGPNNWGPNGPNKWGPNGLNNWGPNGPDNFGSNNNFGGGNNFGPNGPGRNFGGNGNNFGPNDGPMQNFGRNDGSGRSFGRNEPNFRPNDGSRWNASGDGSNNNFGRNFTRDGPNCRPNDDSRDSFNRDVGNRRGRGRGSSSDQKDEQKNRRDTSNNRRDISIDKSNSSKDGIVSDDTATPNRNVNNPFRRNDVPKVINSDTDSDIKSKDQPGSWIKGPDDRDNLDYGDYYRPVQVIDYSNSNATLTTTITPRVIDYGHKPVMSDDRNNFKPLKIINYDHASKAKNSQQQQIRLNATQKRKKRKNKNNPQRKQQNNQKPNNQQQQQQQQTVQKQLPENSTIVSDEQKDAQEQNNVVDADKQPDELEEISDDEDLPGEPQSPPPPPPPMFNTNGTFMSLATESVPSSIFPSTSEANENLPKISAAHVQMSIPTEENNNTISIDEILLKPGRETRPKRICMILRGPPGSGKSHVAKLIKEKEKEMGGNNPRILSIDDYFLIENDYEEKCPKTGKKIPKKEILYEYDKDMEEKYMEYLIKAFKKSVADNFYDFIIIDCNNNSLRSLNEFYCHSKDSGFVPYIIDLFCDMEICLERNIHERSEKDIKEIIDTWKPTPGHYIKLDISSLLQNVIEMEDVENVAVDDTVSENAAVDSNVTTMTTSVEQNEADDKAKEVVTVNVEENVDNDNDEEDSNDSTGNCGFLKSKWETDTTIENLARLDGTSKLANKRKPTMEEYLQMDEWQPPTNSKGKKRVRWADIEEKRKQDKMREVGFVVGQTDWKRMMDPNAAQRALNKTKYIERVNKRR